MSRIWNKKGIREIEREVREIKKGVREIKRKEQRIKGVCTVLSVQGIRWRVRGIRMKEGGTGRPDKKVGGPISDKFTYSISQSFTLTQRRDDMLVIREYMGGHTGG